MKKIISIIFGVLGLGALVFYFLLFEYSNESYCRFLVGCELILGLGLIFSYFCFRMAGLNFIKSVGWCLIVWASIYLIAFFWIIFYRVGPSWMNILPLFIVAGILLFIGLFLLIKK